MLMGKQQAIHAEETDFSTLKIVSGLVAGIATSSVSALFLYNDLKQDKINQELRKNNITNFAKIKRYFRHLLF